MITLSIEYRGLDAQPTKPAKQPKARRRQPPRLTAKDRKLLDLLAGGMQVKETDLVMSTADGISKWRLFNIKKKFGMRTTFQLMAWYAEQAGKEEEQRAD